MVTTSLPGVNFDESLGPNERTIFNINSLQYVVDNMPYQISMMVSAYSFGGTTPSISASLDPFVQIDPSINSSGFSLVASPLSPVPEPSASWLLLCGGLCFRMGSRGAHGGYLTGGCAAENGTDNLVELCQTARQLVIVVTNLFMF